MLPMQLLWHSKDNLSKFVWFLGTGEHTLEPVLPIDELIKVTDGFWVVAAKVQICHSLGQLGIIHGIPPPGQ